MKKGNRPTSKPGKVSAMTETSWTDSSWSNNRATGLSIGGDHGKRSGQEAGHSLWLDCHGHGFTYNDRSPWIRPDGLHAHPSPHEGWPSAHLCPARTPGHR